MPYGISSKKSGKRTITKIKRKSLKMTTDLITHRLPYIPSEIKCLPCQITPSVWPYSPDFWTCPKCNSTYIKKCLFNRVKSFDKSNSQYELCVKITHGNGGVGYIQIHKK